MFYRTRRIDSLHFIKEEYDRIRAKAEKLKESYIKKHKQHPNVIFLTAADRIQVDKMNEILKAVGKLEEHSVYDLVGLNMRIGDKIGVTRLASQEELIFKLEM